MRSFDRNHLAWLAALGLSACATPTAMTRMQEADALAADSQAEAELREHHRHQHRGGVMQFVAMGLDTLGTNEVTRPRVELLQRDLYVCMAPTGDVQRRLHVTIADGVAAGAVDLAAVDGLLGQLEAAAGGVRECSIHALDQLHALLTPVERAELVEKVQAHWEVWRQVNSEEEGSGRGPNGRLGALTRELSLTPDQIERATASLHTALSGQASRFDRTKVDADVQAFGLAFEGASFDARTTLSYANPRLASHGATRMAIFYETVTPLLTPAQRTVLAEHLRAHAGQHPAMSAN